MDILSGEVTLSKLVLSVDSIRRELAPRGSRLFFFYSVHGLFLEGVGVQKSKQEVTRVISLVKSPAVSIRLSYY